MKTQQVKTGFWQSVLTALFILSYVASTASASDIFVYSGGKLTTIHNGDPNKYHPIEWAAWYYSTGMPIPGISDPRSGMWGGDSAKTAQALMEKVKKSQNFELSFNEFAGKGRVRDNPDSTFNVLAPIAVLDKSAAPKSGGSISNMGLGAGSAALNPLNVGALSSDISLDDESERLVDAYTRQLPQIKVSIDSVTQITKYTKGILDPPNGANPYAFAGNVFKEYTGLLKDIYKLNMKLRGVLNRNTDATLAELTKNISRLDELNGELTSNISGWQKNLQQTGNKADQTNLAEVLTGRHHFTKNGLDGNILNQNVDFAVTDGILTVHDTYTITTDVRKYDHQHVHESVCSLTDLDLESTFAQEHNIYFDGEVIIPTRTNEAVKYRENTHVATVSWIGIPFSDKAAAEAFAAKIKRAAQQPAQPTTPAIDPQKLSA